MKINKYIIYSFLLTIGVIIGFALNHFINPIKEPVIIDRVLIDTVQSPEVIKIVKIENKPEKIIDTVFIYQDTNLVENDSINLDLAVVIEDSTLEILKDELIKTVLLPVRHFSKKPIDTLKEQLLGVVDVVVDQIIVEYWSSPIDYKGYKMSKNKLVLYGIDYAINHEIVLDENIFIFYMTDFYIELKESPVFTKYNYKPIQK